VPGASSAGPRPLFVTINGNAHRQYDTDMQTAFAATIESLGGSARTFDAKGEVAAEPGLVTEAIAAGARGIAIAVVDQSVGAAVAKVARQGEIPLLAVDDTIVDEAGVALPHLGFDNRDVGARAGDEAVRLLSGSGWDIARTAVLSAEVAGVSVCDERTKAEKGRLAAAGIDATRVVPVEYSGEIASSATAAAPLIAAHRDVERWVVVGCNDEGVIGATNALRSAGIAPEQVIGVGLGGYAVCSAWATGQPSGLRAAIDTSGRAMGAAAAHALWDAVSSRSPLPAETIAAPGVVTPDSC
jgi:L-arabinose transport system substrate-binding protein